MDRSDIINKEALLKLSKEELAEELAGFLEGLPYHQQKKWVAAHLPQYPQEQSSQVEGVELLGEIKDFCERSRSGEFVSWDDYDHYYGWDDSGDSEEFEEWIELFTDLMKSVMKLTLGGQHREAVEGYRLLFGILKEAGETTDILGNQGAPEDFIELNFAQAIKSYAVSLLQNEENLGLDAAIQEILSVAKDYRYCGGFTGLAEALDPEGRKRLKEILTGIVEEELRLEKRSCPHEVEGLIAIATAEKNDLEILSLKEKFASRNAVYLREVIAHYQEEKDWQAVARWARKGIEHFGYDGEYARALIEALDTLGDKLAAQEAHIAYFLKYPAAGEFSSLKQRSQSLSNWSGVFERLLASSTKESTGWPGRAGLRTRLLLAEGREKEALEEFHAGKGGKDLEEIKLIAKYAVARLSEGMDLTGYKKLLKHRERLKEEQGSLYDWLRLILKNPQDLRQEDYARLAASSYQMLVDEHLQSGKPSRAAPAAHYCAIVVEISRLMSCPDLWTNLLAHLKEAYHRKRLIWQNLRAEGIGVTP
ncbi:hypothetical protein HKBW3C_02092 [Candidatus Hakubella thermalkaliphila]|nr:hypothetical protein HKBW3C_02092 [Candidatus Hakubella thermalkaliphila]